MAEQKLTTLQEVKFHNAVSALHAVLPELKKALGNTFTLEQLKDWTALVSSAADDLDYLFDRFAREQSVAQEDDHPSDDGNA
jgi:hypothetical protein